MVTSIDVQISEATRTIQGLERWLDYAQQLKEAIREIEELEQKRAELDAHLLQLRDERLHYQEITAQPSAPSAQAAINALRQTVLGQRLALVLSDTEPVASESELRLQLASQTTADSPPPVEMGLIFSEQEEAEEQSVSDDGKNEPEPEIEAEPPAPDAQPVVENDFFAAIEISSSVQQPVDGTFAEILQSDPVGDNDFGLGETNWIDELAGMNLEELDISAPTNQAGQSMNDLLFSDIAGDPDSPWADPWNDMLAVADAEPAAPFVPLDDLPEAEWGAVPALPSSGITRIGSGSGDTSVTATVKSKPGLLQKLFFR